jgi:hemerythrin-like metal-binding protein
VIERIEAEKKSILGGMLKRIHMLRHDGYASCGVTDVDDHHRRLIERYEGLVVAILDEQLDDDGLGLLCVNLISYMEDHFALEEMLMTLIDYREAEMHSAHHRRFLNSAARLMQEMRLGTKTCPDFGIMVAEWLLEHEGNLDRGLAHHASSLV